MDRGPDLACVVEERAIQDSQRMRQVAHGKHAVHGVWRDAVGQRSSKPEVAHKDRQVSFAEPLATVARTPTPAALPEQILEDAPPAKATAVMMPTCLLVAAIATLLIAYVVATTCKQAGGALPRRSQDS